MLNFFKITLVFLSFWLKSGQFLELLSRFKFTELTEEVLAECEHFSCGISDLDEYFQKDVIGYTQRMVSRSYAFRPKSNLISKSRQNEEMSNRLAACY